MILLTKKCPQCESKINIPIKRVLLASSIQCPTCNCHLVRKATFPYFVSYAVFIFFVSLFVYGYWSDHLIDPRSVIASMFYTIAVGISGFFGALYFVKLKCYERKD